MTVESVSDTPLEDSCLEIERILRARSPADIRVRPLGVRDALGDDLGEPKAAQAELPIHLAGRWALVGPRTAASGQPCGRCLGRRWQALRPNEERHILERRHGPMRMIGPLPYLTDFAVDVLTELCEQATNDVTPIRPGRGKVYQLALDTLEIRTYTLIADPTCPVCCTPRADTAPGAVPTLATQPKPSPGAYRLRSPLNYDIDIDAYANPVCGALGFGAFPAYESSTTAPVTGALRMRGPFDFHEFFWSGHANRFDASGVLGVMEGLERYAGLWPRDLRDQEIGTYADFKDMALDPRACGLYSDEYYATSTVHVPFREDAMLRWIWGYSLRDERPILVAEQQAYYGRGILGGERDFVMECSNGCAGGGSVEEATLHGMLELIERDAFLLCWYGKQPLPEIDPYTCADPEIKIMVDRLAADGYEMRFFDNRIDLPIPVVTGVAVKKDGGLGTLCYAAGAGLDPEDAVRAALCEIASYVPGFDERVEDKLAEAKALSADYHMVKELRHHALLHGLPEMVRHSDFLLAGERTKQSMDTVYGDWQRARPRNRDLLQDLVFVKDILVDNGFDVIIVDQTSPEQRAESLHTICVIAPGLLPIDFGWTRQRALHLPRTRTALRRAGLRPRVLDRADLHAVPHPFP